MNHIPPVLDQKAFTHTLAARPPIISFALGDPGDLVRQAHDVGAKVLVQVTTVSQALEAAERGADVVIAQGGEAGGYGGVVSTMALVPQCDPVRAGLVASLARPTYRCHDNQLFANPCGAR